MYSTLHIPRIVGRVFAQRCAYSRSVKQIRKKQIVNPGIRFQAGLIRNDDLAEYENIEEMEGDFMKLGITYDQHMREIDSMKEQLKYNIVSQKYFKKHMPNFLTWSDKQQIKFLHRTEPEEWTIEKLSEAFPALPSTITVSIISIVRVLSLLCNSTYFHHFIENCES